jgi:hypothetical protein
MTMTVLVLVDRDVCDNDIKSHVSVIQDIVFSVRSCNLFIIIPLKPTNSLLSI